MIRFIFLLTGVCSLNAVEPNTWPQWRGPARTGHATGANWPANFQNLEVSWRAPLGKGYPGPIVAEDRVFVAETANGDTEVVKALDRKNREGTVASLLERENISALLREEKW